MPLSFQRLQHLIERHETLLEALASLYARMDAAYADAADRYGFACHGCDDNCCLTRFHHHTLVEVLGLFRGFGNLSDDRKGWVSQRARDYGRSLRAAEGQGKGPFRHLCPLNQDTRCLLYGDRPMICRLHGIPHRLRHPLKGTLAGPGCHVFEAACAEDGGRPLDRTPLYAALATLEKTVRQASGYTDPIRLTVAEMVICFQKENPA